MIFQFRIASCNLTGLTHDVQSEGLTVETVTLISTSGLASNLVQTSLSSLLEYTVCFSSHTAYLSKGCDLVTQAANHSNPARILNPCAGWVDGDSSIPPSELGFDDGFV